jgi:RNA polymerase sigma-70 factor (ECF subfamily)
MRVGTAEDIPGNPDRLDKLYRATGPQLLAWLNRRHGDAALAEDLLQETFAAALRHPDRLWQAVSVRAYLFGIARNLSAEATRRARPNAELPDDLPATPDTPADPRLGLMREAISGLEPPLREVLELRLGPELSYEEIAAALAVPVGTVRSRLHHAVRRLRESLARKPNDL